VRDKTATGHSSDKPVAPHSTVHQGQQHCYAAGLFHDRMAQGPRLDLPRSLICIQPVAGLGHHEAAACTCVECHVHGSCQRPCLQTWMRVDDCVWIQRSAKSGGTAKLHNALEMLLETWVHNTVSLGPNCRVSAPKITTEGVDHERTASPTKTGSKKSLLDGQLVLGQGTSPGGTRQVSRCPGFTSLPTLVAPDPVIPALSSIWCCSSLSADDQAVA
jgi:hypothetical protein